MLWGFTGKSIGIAEKISNFLNISKKAFYLTVDVIATFFIGIGGAWLTSKGIDQYSMYFDPSLKSVKIFFLSPIFLIGLGIILYMFAKVFNWIDNNNLLTNNINLIREKEELKKEKTDLEQQMRGATEDNSILKKKLEFSYRELVKTWLSTSMQKLGIEKHHTRATVYYFNNNAFYYVGRYSSNSLIANVTTNKVILNGGVLSNAWERKTYMDLDHCPIYDHGDPYEYIEYQSRTYGFSEEKVKNLTMKPCQYYAKTIVNRCDAIGVIVFECNERFLTESRIRTIEKHCTQHESNLISYIQNFKEYGFITSQDPTNESQNVEAEFFGELEGKLNGTK